MKILLVQIFTITIAINFMSCSKKDGKPKFSQLTELNGDESQLVYSNTGDKIAFTNEYAGNRDIYFIHCDGSDKLIQVTSSDDQEYDPSWSPDDKSLAYTVKRDTNTFIRIDHLFRNRRDSILIEGLRINKPFWSPSGEEIVFNGDDGISRQIYTYNLDSKRMSKVTNDEGRKSNFGFSPDGKFIGYNQRGGDKEDLFLISKKDKHRYNITNHEGHEWYPNWSSDGSKVLFYSTWGSEMTEVWTASVPDGELERISDHISEDFGPYFSPDDKEIVFISKRDVINDLFIYNSETNDTRQLKISAKLKKGWPIWSPDGQKIAFSTHLETPKLYRLNIKSGRTNRLTINRFSEELPAVSKDGRYIAFVSFGNGSESNIMLYDLQDAVTRSILPSYYGQTRPQFSPSNNEIAFIQSPGGSITSNNVLSYSLIDKDSAYLTGFGGVYNFIWSPNSKEIIYARDKSANYSYDIWKLNLETENAREIMSSKASEYPTSVSPNGGHFLFTSNLNGEKRIYKMPLTGGDSQLLKHDLITGWDACYSPNGEQVVFLSDNNMENTTDIYIMNQDGSNLRRLTNDHFEETSPTWMVGGKEIIFSVLKGDKDIWIYNLEAGNNEN